MRYIDCPKAFALSLADSQNTGNQDRFIYNCACLDSLWRKRVKSIAENETDWDGTALAASARQLFARQFGAPPNWIARAPGRVNLIGEHTDYNDGPVLPVAIERQVVVAGAANSEAHGSVWSADWKETATIPLSGPAQVREMHWSNYITGVVAGFRRRGIPVPGFDAVIASDLPHGCGLSSSAALEVATATFIEALTGFQLPPGEKALLCQRAEHDFAGVPCGIMDQFASVFGRRDHAILIDCRSREIRPIRLAPSDVVFLIIDSGVKHSLAHSEYGARRHDCEEASRILGVTSLREWSVDRLEEARAKLPPLLFQRVRHVVTEIARTFAAAEMLQAADWAAVGRLMYASHASLRDDYAVSCPELDEIVTLAQSLGSAGGILGCRMTGGGFGGCAIALARKSFLAGIQEAIAIGYRSRFGSHPGFFVTRAADGASVADVGES